MLELIKKLFGEEATPDKLSKLSEKLKRDYVLQADFDVQVQKFAEEKAAFAQKLEALTKESQEKEFSFVLEQALRAAGARNVKAVRALLETEKLQLAEGEIVGLNEQLEQIKAENGFLFEEPVANVQFVRPLGMTKALVTLADFQKMGYMDRVKLKKEQPELYREFLQKSGGRLCRLI